MEEPRIDNRCPIRPWRKSSHSEDISADCVEVAGFARHIAVRDSKDRLGPQMPMTPAAWGQLLHCLASARRS